MWTKGKLDCTSISNKVESVDQITLSEKTGINFID